MYIYIYIYIYNIYIHIYTYTYIYIIYVYRYIYIYLYIRICICTYIHYTQICIYTYRWTSIKRTCKLCVCLSKNLKWLNKQFKRPLRSDTRPVSRLYDFQVWLQCWRYHYYLLIWRCLSNYDVRYLCAYIKSHRSDVSSVNAVEATFAVTYLCLLFSVGLNFSI